MSKTTQNKGKGRPSIFENNEILEKYIKIWIDQFWYHLPIWELAKKNECSQTTIKRAITFVNKQFVKIPNKELLKGAIFSISERIKKLTTQLEIEYKRPEASVRNIKELNGEIRADEIELNKLRNLYQEKYSIEVEAGGSIKEILNILSKTKK